MKTHPVSPTAHEATLPDTRILLTVEEAARRLSVSRGSAYELVLAGLLRSVKIGRSRRVPVADLYAYVESLRSAHGD